LILSGSSSTTPSHFPSIYTKNVIYSAQANALMVPAGTGATAVAGAGTAASAEFSGYGAPDYIYADGVSYCWPFPSGDAVAEVGWPLVAINPATTLGWTVTGNPLSVAGPLQLP
jgi:hypothetical protein